MALSLPKLLRAGGIAMLMLVLYSAFALGLSPFVMAVVLVVGGLGALVGIIAKQPILQIAGLTLAGGSLFALVALPGTAFLVALVIIIFLVLFGGA